MKLIGYFRSSAAFRVRIALNLKGITVEHASRHLRKGEQRAPDYVAINPQKLVPALVLDSGEVLTQSLAILEYLEETHPEPPLLPKDPVDRARVRCAGADPDRRHPSHPEPAGDELSAREVRPDRGERLRLVAPLDRDRLRRLRGHRSPRIRKTGAFSHGDQPTMADLCLVPQVFNAARFKVDMARYPTIQRIYATCMKHPAFDAAQPAKQPDAEP